MLAIIEAAGWPIWLLLFTSVIAVALIIERSISLRRPRIIPASLLKTVIGEIQSRGQSEDMNRRLEMHSPLGRIFSAALRNSGQSREVMKDAVEDAGRAVSNELGMFLTTLGTIASMSPLLGLFGTIVGMIEIFGSATAAGNDPQVLAHGISVALYNTGFGLMIAIPSMIFYRHFRALVDSFLIEMEQQAIHLVELLHGERR